MSLLSFSHKEMEGSFMIMATNNLLEIPEKEKIDIIIKED